MIAWGRPGLLWLLPVCVLLARVAWWMLRRRERALAELIEPALWPAVVPRHDRRRVCRRLALRFSALALIGVALARPQWGEREEVARRRGLQIVVALDVSKSMLATDLKPSRLQQAKWGVRDLVARLRGDRIGLVAFAGNAFVQCPLTSDYGAFLILLDDVSTDTIPRGGTAVGAAIRTALAAFDAEAGGDRVLMLVTDGESHEDDPLETLDELRARGVRVYAVGVGSPEGELIPLPDGGFLKDRAGRVVKAGLREDVLTKLAAGSGGAYVRAAPGDFGLDRLYEEHVSRLQRAEQEARLLRTGEERFSLFLAAAALMLILEVVLRGTPPAVRAGGAAALLLLSTVGAPAAGGGARERMEEGLRHFRANRWHEAAAAFDAAAKAAPAERLDAAAARLNESLARLRAGESAAAETALEHAMRTADRSLLADALYNRGWMRAQRASAAREGGRLPEAQTNAAMALTDFRDVLLLRPSDHDARVNYELARELLAEITRQITNAPSPTQPEPSSSPAGAPQESAQPAESGNEMPPQSTPQPRSEDASQPADAAPQPAEASGESGPQTMPAQRRRGRMTPEEAEMLLDQIKAEEAAIRWKTRSRAPPVPVEKDW
ncbi:MAG: VWA domain-containing protein [Kiritimatiellae bacterium]|nr:VWA domain-containing protein [Kiritimatiellia bacterium]